MNRKLLLAFVGIVALTGCATSPPAPQKVYVPVAAECPAPTIPDKPDLPIDQLTKDSTPPQVMMAFVTSLVLLKGYSNELLEILYGYSAEGEQSKD